MEFRVEVIVHSLLLLFLPHATANHNQWWRCTAECKRCVRKMMPLDNSITELYSGLFSRQPPVTSSSSTYIYSGAYRINSRYTDQLLTSSYRRRSLGNTEISPGTPIPHSSKCCETEVTHIVLNTVTHLGHNYTVVHLKNEYQFIPVGRCRSNTTCGTGRCFQRYRPHRVLVYNHRSPTTGPLIFIPKDVPSHCECRNIITRKS